MWNWSGLRGVASDCMMRENTKDEMKVSHSQNIQLKSDKKSGTRTGNHCKTKENREW